MVWDNFSVNEIKKKLMIFLEGLSERNRNLFIDAVILGYHYKETAFYNFKDNIHSLYFFDNNNFYKIRTNNLPKKEIIRVAESFEMIVGL